MSREVHGGRALLNLPGHHSTAAIVAEIDDTASWPKGGKRNTYDGYQLQPEVKCKITDCDGAVNIEFDIKTANQLDNSLHKVDMLIDVLDALRAGLIIEHHRLHDRLDSVPNNKRDELYDLRDAVGKRTTIYAPTLQEG